MCVSSINWQLHCFNLTLVIHLAWDGFGPLLLSSSDVSWVLKFQPTAWPEWDPEVAASQRWLLTDHIISGLVHIFHMLLSSFHFPDEKCFCFLCCVAEQAHCANALPDKQLEWKYKFSVPWTEAFLATQLLLKLSTQAPQAQALPLSSSQTGKSIPSCAQTPRALTTGCWLIGVLPAGLSTKIQGSSAGRMIQMLEWRRQRQKNLLCFDLQLQPIKSFKASSAS